LDESPSLRAKLHEPAKPGAPTRLEEVLQAGWDEACRSLQAYEGTAQSDLPAAPDWTLDQVLQR
jgi:hypothetical protein